MIYYTVFDSKGNKVADCGSEESAKWLADVRQGTYKTNRINWNQTIDVEISELELPSIEISGQKLTIQQPLPKSKLEPFIKNFHD